MRGQGRLGAPVGAGQAGPVDHGPEERRLLLEGGQLRLDLLRRGRLVRVVHAVDRVVGLGLVVDVVAVLPVVVRVRHRQQHRAVATQGPGQRDAQVRPPALVVHGHGDAGQRVGLVQLAGAVALDRVRLEAGHPALELGERGVRVGAQRAVGLLDAVAQEQSQFLVEGDGLGQVLLLGRQVRVDGAVEHEVPDPLRELLGVHRAQVGAVGLAEVGQLLVAERGAQDVHVARRVRRADVGQQAARLGLTLLREELVLRLDFGHLLRGRRGRGRVDEGVHLTVAQALHRIGLADAPRVEADEVVAGEDGRVDHVPRGGVLQAGAARAAGVHQQRAEPVRRVGGGLAHHRDPDGLARRVGVVQRHLQRAALVAAVARGPGEFLAVERGQVRCGARGQPGLAGESGRVRVRGGTAGQRQGEHDSGQGQVAHGGARRHRRSLRRTDGWSGRLPAVLGRYAAQCVNGTASG